MHAEGKHAMRLLSWFVQQLQETRAALAAERAAFAAARTTWEAQMMMQASVSAQPRWLANGSANPAVSASDTYQVLATRNPIS